MTVGTLCISAARPVITRRCSRDMQQHQHHCFRKSSMIILAIFTCALAEVVVSTWLFCSLDVVIELPLVERVRSKLRVDALIFVVDKDCLEIARLRDRDGQ